MQRLVSLGWSKTETRGHLLAERMPSLFQDVLFRCCPFWKMGWRFDLGDIPTAIYLSTARIEWRRCDLQTIFVFCCRERHRQCFREGGCSFVSRVVERFQTFHLFEHRDAPLLILRGHPRRKVPEGKRLNLVFRAAAQKLEKNLEMALELPAMQDPVRSCQTIIHWSWSHLQA